MSATDLLATEKPADGLTAEAAIAAAKNGSGRRRFHVGLTEGCPASFVVVGGVTFPRKTTRTEAGQELISLGAVTMLSDVDLQRVQDAVRYQVVREQKDPKGGTRRAFIYSTKSPGFEAEADDKPLKGFLTIKELPPEAEPAGTLDDVAAKAERAEATAGEAKAEAKADDKQVRTVARAAKAVGAKLPAD